MTATDLDDAKQECQTDPSCKMFYRVCGYKRFRKCNENAYEEASECTDILVPSMLFKRGNIIMLSLYSWSEPIEPPTAVTTLVFYIILSFSDNDPICKDGQDWCTFLDESKDCCSEFVKKECPETCKICNFAGISKIF